jgi:hypothetical protein
MVQPARGLGLTHECLLDALVARRIMASTWLQLHRLENELAVQDRIEREIRNCVAVAPQLAQDE